MKEGLYLDYPELFLPHSTGLEWRPWQAHDINRLLNVEGKRKLSVVGGHGVGRTFFSAGVAYTFSFVKSPSAAIITGPGGGGTFRFHFMEQLSGIMERSIFSSPDSLYSTKEGVKSEHGPHEMSIVWTKPSLTINLEKLFMSHAGKNSLMVVEEAGLVSDGFIDYILSSTEERKSYQLFSGTGSANKENRIFYDSHHSQRQLYETDHVPSCEIPTLCESVKKWMKQWGRNSEAYRTRVDGEFVS